MGVKWLYYMPEEVVLHNQPDDIWVSFLGKVYDLTPLAEEFKGTREIKPLLAYAGKDVTHWFNKRTQDIKHRVHTITGVYVPYIPHGPHPHVHAHVPTTAWKPLDDYPWWLDKRYFIGYLTKKARPLRVLNALAPHTHRNNLIWVCSEDRLNRIVERLAVHNSHAGSYTFKFEGRELDMDKTLEENGVLDEREKYLALGMTDDNYIPAVKLYFNDDLTVK